MTNPLLAKSSLQYQLPDFQAIKDEHYKPAFEAGFAEQQAAVQRIISEPDVTFENTLVELEKSAPILSRTLNVFYNKVSADSNDEILALEAEIAPRLSAHQDSILMNEKLFARVKLLSDQAETGALQLSPEDLRLLNKYLDDFLFAGAALSHEARSRVAEINERISTLQAEFHKRLLDDTNDLVVLVENEQDLDGLSAAEIASAAATAEERGLQGYAIPLLNYSGHPLLAKLKNRELRKEIMLRTFMRGNRDNPNNTFPLVSEMLKLRAEKAKFFGFSNYAQYVTSQQTAKSPEKIHEVLGRISPKATSNAKSEAEELEKKLRAEHGPQAVLESWDWDFYTERVRAEKYSIDTSELQAYFELNNVLEKGVFFAAEKLYGLTFLARPDLVGYHPDAQVYEVFRDGKPWALYLLDPYTRSSKSGGAWMNNLVDQSHLLDQRPVVVNNMNIPKPAAGDPTLLTFDEVNTLFHEFGHTLHGLLSDVRYPRLSGTNVERDFVEFPSQVNEMWMLWPEVLQNYAIHHQTGESLGLEWIEKLDNAKAFNQGFATSHYLQAAVLDLALHEAEEIAQSLAEFEAAVITEYGLAFHPVPTRYKINYFSHIFDGGYSAGYYGYIWSEVLDADTVDWFRENGGLTRANGQRFADLLLSRGGTVDSMEMYEEFRGKPASIEPLLARRGLL